MRLYCSMRLISSDVWHAVKRPERAAGMRLHAAAVHLLLKAL